MLLDGKEVFLLVLEEEGSMVETLVEVRAAKVLPLGHLVLLMPSKIIHGFFETHLPILDHLDWHLGD